MICTPAFGLPAKYIFHAVCPAWQGGGFGEAEQLAGAYHSALELAVEYHCESVAFPLLSSGNYGYPKEQAFRIAVDTITQYVMEHDLTVYLVLYDRHSLAVSRKLFASVEEYIDDHYVVQNDESYGVAAAGWLFDTLACITGSIAEAFYGMPPELRQETLKCLPEEMRAAYELFRQNLERRM